MAGRRIQPVAGGSHSEQEVGETPILSPRTTTFRLLSVEIAVGEVQEKLQTMQETLASIAGSVEQLVREAAEKRQADLAREVHGERNFGDHDRERNRGIHFGNHLRGRGRGAEIRPDRRHLRGQERRHSPVIQDRHQELQDWSSSTEEDQTIAHRGRRNAGPGERYDSFDFKMKIDLPSYDGKRNIEVFLDWVKNTENFFNYMGTPEYKKVQLVALKLKGGASAWWDQLEVNRRRQGKDVVRTWKKMKRLLKARFLPPNYEQTLYSQYQNCRQGSKTLTDYIEEFHRLGARTNLAENEQHLIARFVEGLRPDIQEKVRLQPFRWLTDAIAFAETLEEIIEVKNKKGPRRQPWEWSTPRRFNSTPSNVNQAVS